MPRLTRFLVSLSFLLAVVGIAVAQDVGITGEAKVDTKIEAKTSDSEKEVSAETESAAESSTEPSQSAAVPEGVVGETATSATQDTGMSAGTYGVRLRDLEQRINELKEQIFRSKARLSLLAETVLQGVVAGSQATLIHENRMGSSYLLVKVVYALDGAPIFNKADEEGELDDREKFDIYNGSIVPGEHTLTVNLEYRGHGYGIFSYLKGYRFKVRSNYTFTAPEGKAIVVRVVGFEKGGPTAPLEERPAIRYVERVASDTKSALEEGGE
jgi:hypothetical protein